MSEPKISVIIPAYNAQEYLRECLDSVLAQSFSDFEAIVVNDGSTDDTLKIAEEYALKDPRIKILNEVNSGVSAARNIGIKSAKGTWLTFLDSDDTITPDSLSILYEVSAKTQCKIVKASFSQERINIKKVPTKYSVEIFDAFSLTERILYQTICDCSAWATLFHKTLFIFELFLEGIRYEDLDFFYRIYLRVDNIAVVNYKTYYYRPNPHSFVNTFSTSRLDVLSVTERLEQYMRKNYPQLLPAAQDRRLSANFNMFALMGLVDKEKYQNEMQKCWSLIRSYRMSSLFSRKTRLKNKMGTLASLFGQRAFLFFAKFVYK